MTLSESESLLLQPHMANRKSPFYVYVYILQDIYNSECKQLQKTCW